MTPTAVKMIMVGPCGQLVAIQNSSAAASATTIRSASSIPGNGSGTCACSAAADAPLQTAAVLTTSSPFATVRNA